MQIPPTDLRLAAQKIESQFLSEMLKHTGFGGAQNGAEFDTFMRDAVSEKLVAAGGIGLSQTILTALEARND